ncbi:hypothetical protein KG088_17260 [Halomonas sp. TRM85114]|uniref:hypothetical protein n=1 Tax=Halomonas jincaotanensis TaxID=2810616 RepID=UPI001BD2A52B|nr:hypothetical protein [Halomonas jincaotanensis]MBS9405362.1 hypothetical protein [Halomonas jincaotanensis]
MDINWNTIASIATAIGVALGVVQLHLSKKLAQTQFEDSLVQQYRVLAKDIPVDCLIGKEVSQEQWPDIRELIFNYLDLSNEQIALRANRRIGKKTWKDWKDGIIENLDKPAFSRLWDEVKESSPGTFSFLEKLELSGFNDDPKSWR